MIVSAQKLYAGLRKTRPASTYDQAVVWITLVLLAIGLVMVYSSSIAMAEGDKDTGYKATYFLSRHAVFLLVALIAGVMAFQVPMRLMAAICTLSVPGWLGLAGDGADSRHRP
jgi:cell division protein FtsW